DSLPRDRRSAVPCAWSACRSPDAAAKTNPAPMSRPSASRQLQNQRALLLHHRVALGLEFVVSFPFRKFVGVGHLVADLEKKIDILHRSGKVPVGFHVVARLMVIFQIVFVRAERAVGRAGDQMLVLANVKRWQADFAELEIVRAINAALFRSRI